MLITEVGPMGGGERGEGAPSKWPVLAFNSCDKRPNTGISTPQIHCFFIIQNRL